MDYANRRVFCIRKNTRQFAPLVSRALGVAMAKRPKQRRSLDEILWATSDTLFPAKLGRKQVKVSSKDVDGDTPLHVMAARGDRFACQALIEAGATVDAIGDMGQTPLHVAISCGYLEIVELLLNAGARTDVISEFGESQFEKARKRGGEIARLVARS